jgi:mannan endo-1,4-beta-mannosidase
VGGEPFRFLGANASIMHGKRERESYTEVLDAIAADGLKVVRIWALGEAAPSAPAWERNDYVFRAGPDGWVAGGYQQLDRVLAAARERGLRAIVTLSNYWSDFGGVPRYLAWAGLPTDGFGAKDRFFSDERCRAWYRAHLQRLVTRINSVTGVAYRNDPTILAWELMNESKVETPEGSQARLAWLIEMGGWLKREAPHQLVGAGLLGYRTQAERRDWIEAHRLPVVDYCDAHVYAEEDPTVHDRATFDSYVDDRAQAARFVVGKPLVLGEVGFRASSPQRQWRGRPPHHWLRALLQRLFFDGGGGALLWTYRRFLGTEQDYSVYVDDARSTPLRGALQAEANALASAPPKRTNPRLSAALGAQPLHSTWLALRSPRYRPLPASIWRRRSDADWQLALDPLAFSMGRFEAVGTWTQGQREHAYGAGPGQFDFELPALPPTAGRHRWDTLRLDVRLSAELPGERGPDDQRSAAVVWLDRHRLGEVEAPADDGQGQWRSLVVTSPARVGVLTRPGRHRLRFEVPERDAAGRATHGLCLYGPPGSAGVSPGRASSPAVGHGPTAEPPVAPSARATPAAPNALGTTDAIVLTLSAEAEATGTTWR